MTSYLSVGALALVVREREHSKGLGRPMPPGFEDLPSRFQPGPRLSLGAGIHRAISLLTREGWLQGLGLLHTCYPAGRNIATALFEGISGETTLGLYHSRPNDIPILTLDDREFINRTAIRSFLDANPELSARIMLYGAPSLNPLAILESMNSTFSRFEDAIHWIRQLTQDNPVP